MTKKNSYTTFIILVISVMLNAQDLRINEVLPINNNASLDSFGESSSWIEIYNNSSAPIQLSNYYISNDFQNKLKWKLPTKTLLPQAMILVYCTGKNLYSPDYHSNFKLLRQGDTLGIFFKDGSTIDVFSYDTMPANVSFGRQPDGSNHTFFFVSSTPKSSNNNSQGYTCFLNPPIVNNNSGLYSSPLTITTTHPVSGVQLRYTLNGEEPTTSSSLFTGQLQLSTNYSTNYLSLIPTNPATNAPIGDYTVKRMNNRGWLPPAFNAPNINVFQVKAYKQGCIPSKSTVRSYLLDDGTITFPNLPIISLQTNKVNLFSNDSGIYVYGNSPMGNYNKRGKSWEREMYFEMFDKNKQIIINQRIVGELHGNGSRHSTQKNIRISARKKLGKGTFNGLLFEDYPINRFKHLIIRSPGHRPDCMPRDELATYLMKRIGFDIQHYQTSVMYLNGEYWGIHVLKERLDEDYISIKYDVSENNIVILESTGELYHGLPSDTVHYHQLSQFIRNNSLDDTANFNYLKTQMDIDNYLNYMSAEIFIGNGDWPINNMRFWRKRGDYNDFASPGLDGRWRWMFFDIDGGFGGTCQDVYWTINNLERALRDTGYYEKYTRFFRDLCASQTFRNMFINYSCDKLNTHFLPSITLPKLQQILNEINPEMMSHVKRWRYPSISTTLSDRMNETPSLTKWNYLIQKFDTFLQVRGSYVLKHMKNYWNLSDTARITIDVNNPVMGYVQINSVHLTQTTEGVSSVVYPWSGTYFQNIDIPIVAHPYPGFRFKEWKGIGVYEAKTKFNITSDTSFVAVFEHDPNYTEPQPIVINELQAWNTNTRADDYYEFDDWIELYNPNEEDVDIANYFLTDDSTNLTKYWVGYEPTIIKGKEFSLFWADNQNEQGRNHMNFKLNRNGEWVAIVAPDGITIIDSVTYRNQLQDHSFGREVDAGYPWIDFDMPTPQYSNLLTNIWETTPPNKISLYPNPTSDQVIFSKSISGSLYSITGVEVMRFAHSAKINVSHLSSGIYIVKCHSNGSAYKLIIEK